MVPAGLAGAAESVAKLLEAGAVAAHAVALSVDLHDSRVVKEPVEDRDGDGGILEDRAPLRDPPCSRAVLLVGLWVENATKGSSLC